MISLFRKKVYLVDLLEGFIDIHNHILPGIDDGAKTVEDSVQLLQEFSQLGVHNFIMTPHIMHNYYENDATTITNSKAKLEKELIKRKMTAINFSASAEHMIDSNFENILEKKRIMPLGQEHLLIEMSYLQPPINFDEAVAAITHNRYFPILAHPERYNFLLGKWYRYNEFKDQGVLFQLNMLSLGDFYGKEVSRTAQKLLEARMIDFMGSDVHNMSQLNALKTITLSKKTLRHIQPVIEKTIGTFSI